MKAILIALLLSQDPPIAVVGQPLAADAPLKGPELIDDLGNISPMTAGDLEPGVVCATHVQATKQRDDKAACHAALAVMKSGSGIDWPMVFIVAGTALAIGAAAGAGAAVAVQKATTR